MQLVEERAALGAKLEAAEKLLEVQLEMLQAQAAAPKPEPLDGVLPMAKQWENLFGYTGVEAGGMGLEDKN